ncbi:MAG: D-alanyl-D-alanine carboxypeptidase family protein [Massiliimalia sp.]|jgi:D-alanyl-D-alanine carboxypeptidase (penicillin-binding protein 5/6)
MGKRVLAFLVTLVMFITCTTVVFSEETEGGAASDGLDIGGSAAILIEMTTGKVIYAKNEHQQLEPASVTKIMTMALVLEQVQQGNLKYDDIVTASANARAMGGSEIFLDTGEQMTVYDLMMATAVASANDAAVALGEHLAGNTETAEQDFVAMMNAKAEELGMNDTHFVNPCGLHEEGHVTSAYDVALMARYLMSFPDAQTFTTQNIYPIREGVREYKMRNSNEMIRSYEGCIGIKTGFTNEAGYCLAAAATREGETFIGVILGAESAAKRNEDMAKMLDYAFANYQTYDVQVPEVKVKDISVKLGQKSKLEVAVPDLQVGKQLIAKGTVPEITTQVDVEKSVKAPIQEGTKVGTVSVLMDGEVLQTFDLTAKDTVEKRGFWRAFTMLFRKLVA